MSMKFFMAFVAMFAMVSMVSAETITSEATYTEEPFGMVSTVMDVNEFYTAMTVSIKTEATFEEYTNLTNQSKFEPFVQMAMATKDALNENSVSQDVTATFTLRASNGKALAVYMTNDVADVTSFRNDVPTKVKFADKNGKVKF
jgi:hypothetical protein